MGASRPRRTGGATSGKAGRTTWACWLRRTGGVVGVLGSSRIGTGSSSGARCRETTGSGSSGRRTMVTRGRPQARSCPPAPAPQEPSRCQRISRAVRSQSSSRPSVRRECGAWRTAPGVRGDQPAAAHSAAVCRRGAVRPAAVRVADGVRRCGSPAAARATAVRVPVVGVAVVGVACGAVVRDSRTSTPVSMEEYRAAGTGPGSSVRTSVVGAVIGVIAMSRVSLLWGMDRSRGRDCGQG